MFQNKIITEISRQQNWKSILILKITEIYSSAETQSEKKGTSENLINLLSQIIINSEENK